MFILVILALYHTIVSELDPFPVKKSQKLAAGDGLLSSCGVCLTQMLLSLEPLRLEQLPLPAPPSVKLSADPAGPCGPGCQGLDRGVWRWRMRSRTAGPG